MSGNERSGDRQGRDRGEPSEGVRDLESTLEAIRFNPRQSLEAEIYGRLHRESSSGGRTQASWPHRYSFIGGPHRLVLWLALAATVMTLLVWSLRVGKRTDGRDAAAGLQQVTLDRCCSDLDGGGVPDDGVLIEAGRNEAVLSIAVYEDRDGSGDFSPADMVRVSPNSEAPGDVPLPRGAITSDHCCSDYDLGGRTDDGLFLVGVPPDRILLAAVYEDRDASGGVSAADLVRFMVP